MTLKLFVLFTAIFVCIALPFLLSGYKNLKEVELEAWIWMWSLYVVFIITFVF